jgi:hypothetical protein
MSGMTHQGDVEREDWRNRGGRWKKGVKENGVKERRSGEAGAGSCSGSVWRGVIFTRYWVSFQVPSEPHAFTCSKSAALPMQKRDSRVGSRVEVCCILHQEPGEEGDLRRRR